MKKLYYIWPVLAILAFACTSSPGAPMFNSADPTDAVGVIAANVAPENGQVKEIVHQIGPIDLPAETSAANMIERPKTMHISLDEPSWITKVSVTLIDTNGNPLPSDYIAEIILSNDGEKNPLCNSKTSSRPFAVLTNSVSSVSLPSGMGYFMSNDSTIDISAIFYNSSSVDLYGISAVVKLSTVPQKLTKKMTAVEPWLLEPSPCDHSFLSVEPSGNIESVLDFNFPEGGSIVRLYALLQDFGVFLSLTQNEESDPFWVAQVEKDDKHHITDLPAYEENSPIELATPSTVTLRAAYENSQDDWFNAATAATMIYILPKVGATDVQKMLLAPSSE